MGSHKNPLRFDCKTYSCSLSYHPRFRPSSGNNANLTDVWGSALAVDAGAVTGERAARIVAWFGAHWSEVN